MWKSSYDVVQVIIMMVCNRTHRSVKQLMQAVVRQLTVDSWNSWKLHCFNTFNSSSNAVVFCMTNDVYPLQLNLMFMKDSDMRKFDDDRFVLHWLYVSMLCWFIGTCNAIGCIDDTWERNVWTLPATAVSHNAMQHYTTLVCVDWYRIAVLHWNSSNEYDVGEDTKDCWTWNICRIVVMLWTVPEVTYNVSNGMPMW